MPPRSNKRKKLVDYDQEVTVIRPKRPCTTQIRDDRGVSVFKTVSPTKTKFHFHATSGVSLQSAHPSSDGKECSTNEDKGAPLSKEEYLEEDKTRVSVLTFLA